MNRRVIEALARAGAFDCIEPKRATVLASAGSALEAAERAERMASQSSLFGAASTARRAAKIR
jgi:DNA polymerase-3 subunit alpha